MNPRAETVILRELLAQKEGSFVSGSRLAQLLDVTRVAVWAQMEKLRGAGFEFEARPRCGYRITQTPADLQPVFLQALMPPEWETVPIIFHEEIDSTNSEAERELAAGRTTPFVVLARAQTQGRGRLGRKWLSSDSGNLYMSFVFQPQLPPVRMQVFTLWMGASLCDFLSRMERVAVQVKWPNDLMLGGKKLAGMLTEARIDNDQIRDLVFGLGINVNGRTGELPPELRATATSLAESTGRAADLNRFTARLLTCILHAYSDFVSRDVREDLQRLWLHYDFLGGKQVTAIQGGQRFTGRAGGIDPKGFLLLEQETGSVIRVHAGDVTLEKSTSA